MIWHRGRWARTAAASVMLVGVAVGACGGGDDAFVLDTSPRVADDQGVATSIVRGESITLDGERTYAVRQDLSAFSTYTLVLEPMVRRESQYVLIGLRGGEVEWMAGVSEVLELAGQRLAFYTGTLVEVISDGLVFDDGTVLTPAPELELPTTFPVEVSAEIDVDRHQVTALRDGAGRAITGEPDPSP